MSLLQIDFEKFQSSCALLDDSLTRLPPLAPEMLNNSFAMEPCDALVTRFERFVEIAVASALNSTYPSLNALVL